MQFEGVRSTSQVAKSFMGTGFKLVPILVLLLPETTNRLPVPTPPLEVTNGIPLVTGVPVAELTLRPPIPPIRLLEPVAELPPDAMMDPDAIECPPLIGVLGAPTALAMIEIASI